MDTPCVRRVAVVGGVPEGQLLQLVRHFFDENWWFAQESDGIATPSGFDFVR